MDHLLVSTNQILYTSVSDIDDGIKILQELSSSSLDWESNLDRKI